MMQIGKILSIKKPSWWAYWLFKCARHL